MKNKDGIVRKGMKMRRLAVLLGACLLLPSANLHALGMGDIDVHSGLNQPLDATIQLLSVNEAELMQLEVVLAPKDAFERMGLERLSVLQRLEFEVVTDRGVSFVKVSSEVPIREPFLDFILTVSWANGQMLREYTLLLDPPIFDEGQSPSSIEAAVTTPSTISRDEVDRFADAAENVSFDSAGGSAYGPTKRSDTLWAVAKQMRGDLSASVPQMMLAILKENPEAFFNNNVNNLKAGYILRTPQEQAITSISRGQAAAETNQQYQDWLARKGMSPSGARQLASNDQAPQANAGLDAEGLAADAGQGAGAPASDARLQIVSPDDSEGGSGMGGAEVEALQQQLAMALSSAEVSRQENADLKQRLVELESRLGQMQERLVSVQDGTLSDLQGAAIAMDPDSAALTPVEGVESPLSDAIDEAASSPGLSDAPVVAAEPVVQTPAEPIKPVITNPAPVAAVVDEMPVSFVDELLADPKMLAAIAGGGVAFLVLVLVMMRRRKAENEDFFDTDDKSLATNVSTSGAGAATTTSLLDEASGKVAPDSAKDDDFVVDLADLSSDGDDFSGFGNELGSIHTEESEIDPIAEADVYLAYRRYEQAEALLKEAIQSDDGRNELKVKLLEIYFTTKDKEAFEGQSEGLYASLAGSEDGLWEQVVEMGRELCPDHPLFSEGGSTMLDAGDGALAGVEGSGSSASGDLLDDMDFDSLSEPESLPEVSESLDTDIDLDLDTEFDFGDLDNAELSVDDAVIDDLDFSTDLDLDSLDETAGLDLDESFDLDDSKDKTVVDKPKDKVDADVDTLEELSGLEDFVAESNDSGLDDLQSASDDFLSDGFELDADELSMGDELLLDQDVDLSSDELSLGDGVEVGDSSFLDAEEGLTDFLDELDDVSSNSDLDDSKSKSQPPQNDNLAGELDGVLDSSLDEGNEFDLDFASSLDEFESLDNVVSFDSQDSSSKSKAASVQPDEAADLVSDLDGLSDVLVDEGNDISLDMDLDGLDLGGLELGEELTDVSAEASNAVEADSGSEWEIEPAISSFGDMDEEYSLFESTDDVVGTKLDLAKAYIDMGDQDGARSILDEVVKEGSDTQREEAEQLMIQIG